MNGKWYSVNGERPAEASVVRDAAVQDALTAYENARMDGLCHDGAWECVLDVLRARHMSQLADELKKEIIDAQTG